MGERRSDWAAFVIKKWEFYLFKTEYLFYNRDVSTHTLFIECEVLIR